ncbi:hypothetical protein L6164_014261 [Bauhinia variegata]|uniref:Uncharacterized protein n=1 Tax=Bauhinia variegata TaxID=167791 RepID=A0ACB9NIQ3_BAUVA|nr:hypothetical protein L6164_014261 [Bauhinia variegata]
MASRARNALSNSNTNPSPSPSPRTCLCSPTTHPGSFRCSLHRNKNKTQVRTLAPPVVQVSSNHLHRQRESPTSPKADSVQAILLKIIKPSTNDLQSRKNFQTKPTRFCLMNGNRDVVAVS